MQAGERGKKTAAGCWLVGLSVNVKSLNVPPTYGRTCRRSVCKLKPDLLFTSYAFQSTVSPSFHTFVPLSAVSLKVKSTKTFKRLQGLNLFYRNCSGQARKREREILVIKSQSSWFDCRLNSRYSDIIILCRAGFIWSGCLWWMSLKLKPLEAKYL